MAGRRGFPLCFCSFARPRSGESLRCIAAEENMLRLRAVQPVGVAENDEADDEDHGDRADGDALVAGRLADDGDDQRAEERRALAADVEQAEVFAALFGGDDDTVCACVYSSVSSDFPGGRKLCGGVCPDSRAFFDPEFFYL